MEEYYADAAMEAFRSLSSWERPLTSRAPLARACEHSYESGGEGTWVTCVIAVTDLLDADVEVEDHDMRLAWEIRQSELNHHAELLATTAIHHELYSVIWPQLRPDGWAGVEHAFASMTRMSIADYFTIGSTVMARLVNFANSGQGAPMIAPET